MPTLDPTNSTCSRTLDSDGTFISESSGREINAEVSAHPLSSLGRSTLGLGFQTEESQTDSFRRSGSPYEPLRNPR
jgi:hypothetical protein